MKVRSMDPDQAAPMVHTVANMNKLEVYLNIYSRRKKNR